MTTAPHNPRNLQIDALKGAAILLVVAGHAVGSLPNFDANIFFRVIYSFHMPLFMFISGFVAALSKATVGINLLKKKFLVLVVPFIAWYIISYFANGTYLTVMVKPYVKRLVLSPDWGLWFLWVLFLNFCFLAAALWLKKKIGPSAFLLVCLLIWLEPINYFGMSLVKWQFCFFLLGYLISLYREKLKPFKNSAYCMSLIGFPVLVAFWYRNSPPTYSGAQRLWLNAHQLGFINEFLVVAYNFIVPVLGIGFACFLIESMRGNRVHKILAWFGLFTMDIYVSHQYFMKFAFGSGLILVVSSMLIALSASLALSFLIIRRNKLANQVLLGNRGPSPLLSADQGHTEKLRNL